MGRRWKISFVLFFHLFRSICVYSSFDLHMFKRQTSSEFSSTTNFIVMRLTRNSVAVATAVFLTACSVFFLFLNDSDYSKFNINSLSTKYIVFWTESHPVSPYILNNGSFSEEDLKSINCPVTNCVLTNKRNMFENPADFDAIIFLIGENHFDGSLAPIFRSEKQFYILMGRE